MEFSHVHSSIYSISHLSLEFVVYLGLRVLGGNNRRSMLIDKRLQMA